MKRLAIPLGLLVVLAADVGDLLGEPPADAGTETQPSGTEMIQLNFPANLEVRVLIEYVSKRLGMNIRYDESVGRKRVTILSPAKIPKDSLPALLESVLKTAGLALVDSEPSGWKEVVAGKELIAITKGVEQDAARVEALAPTTAVTQVFQLQHAPTADVEKTIAPFLSKPGGNSFSIPERDLIVVTDYAGNLKRVSSLIELIDRPGRETTVRFVDVRHVSADELAKRVTALIKEKDQVESRTGRRVQRRLTLTAEPRLNQVVVISAAGDEADALELIARLDVPSDAVTKSYRFSQVAPQRIDKLVKDFAGPDRTRSEYRSSIDAESGLLIATAPKRIHDYIEALAGELDVAPAADEAGNVRFYKLMNTTAASVLATIRALETGESGLTAAVEGFEQSSASGGRERFTGPNYPPPALGEELPKPPAYRPTATGPASRPAEEQGTLGVATVRTADAVVTVDPNTNTIIVVAPPRVQAIYKRLIGMLDRRRPQVMIEVTLVTLDTSENFSLGVELSRAEQIDAERRYLVFSSFGLSQVDPVSGALALAPGVGFNGVLIAPNEVNIVLRALSTSGRSKVVAAPRVLVNDNATATLSSVAESPFTSINASDTVSTTSFAGYASAGTTITATPHISEGDHLQLDYSVTLSSFTGEGAAGIPPPRQTNTINSEVTIPDGYAVIVGGLTRTDHSKTVSRIPGLGHIPIIEYLFSTRSVGDSQSTLFAFIRPVILRDDRFEDLKYLSRRDLELAELPPNFPASGPQLMQ